MTTTATSTVVRTVDVAHIASVIGLVIILALILLLISKDIAQGSSQRGKSQWNDALNVGVVPLVISFAMIVLVKFSAVFS